MNRCLFLFFLLIFGCNSNKNHTLTVAASANMQYAIKDLAEAFSRETGLSCATMVSSSGKLTAQIQQGAPIDVFLSADEQYAQQLIRSGHAPGPAMIYAFGRLILWSNTPGIVLSLDSLAQASVAHIAIANPQTAPYGAKALLIIESFNPEIIAPKLVYGESISQTNQFILSQAAQIGITAQSVAFAPQIELPGRWMWIDTTIYEPISQSMVTLNNRSDFLVEAQLFMEFILSPQGQEILKKYGYLLPQN